MFKISAEVSASGRWLFSSALAVSVLCSSTVWAASMGAVDSGAQLNQAREYMERQRIAQQMEEDQERQQTKVETETQKPEQSAAQVTFILTRVDTDPSKILTEAEIKAITDPYVGKTASLQDLYDMTAAINKLYEAKGYAVCRAYLPPQRIHEGAVQIKLLEGRTGNVTVNGLRFTRQGYVTHRIHLEPGKVANTDILNDELQRFNATNDVQLRILVHAGEKPGTTDYEIAAFEPKNNHQVSLYVDNHGYDTSGRWREGVFYTMRSVTGQRDALRMNYLRSKGTNIFGANYSIAVNNLGTMLDFDYGTNTTKIIKGNMEPLGVKGHSYVAGITLRHPLRVDEKRRYEVGFQYLHQKSQTDIGTKSDSYVKWVNDTRNTYIPYISFTHYGKSSVLYHKHSLAFTGFNNLYNTSDNYKAYRLDSVYQKRLGGGQMLLGRLNAQVASEKKNMSTSDYFYIGGANSVRGYEESFLGGNQGFSASLTWQAPIDKKQIWNAFTFVDYGRVFGDERTVVDHTLVSTGLGVTASYKNFYSSLTLGIPLKREFKSQTEKVDKTRIHFNCSMTF
ncbi:MAG: ShlB/FhaC/HecB family hemolysin secretion/activation protein [Acidaminococcaceae bacterium]|nr:ShlB/FhaC/HecB family hemolysin secretion/activation protein [Acidaminococcaceae bacterium]